MAGYIFAVAQNRWKDVCEDSIKHGFFTPFTPDVDSIALESPRKRKAINKILCATFGDMITMKDGDNVYFLSNRKIYGIGRLVDIAGDCKYDNYSNASALLPDCDIRLRDVLTIKSTRARWVCFFEPSPHFFKKGVDMDDVLRYRPSAFKMLRAFEGASFIKIDDDENRALREYISLVNESAYDDIESTTYEYSDKTHRRLSSRDLSAYKMDINRAFEDSKNWRFLDSEMFIEAALLQQLSTPKDTIFGKWDYVTHQLIASPFKPLKYVDKIDIYGYQHSTHYPDAPKLITKYLLIELKHEKINEAALKQTMQYVDWVCSEYASGDYSRIEAFVVGPETVRKIESIVQEKCQRNYISETHPARAQTWHGLRLIKYAIDHGINFLSF